jgi:hypothetical protein
MGKFDRYKKKVKGFFRFVFRNREKIYALIFIARNWSDVKMDIKRRIEDAISMLRIDAYNEADETARGLAAALETIFDDDGA